MSKRPTLVLFDIDGTLIDPGGAGRKAMTAVFSERFSIPDVFDGMRMSGKTDIQIIKEGLAILGLASEEEGLVSTLLSDYVRALESEIILRKRRVMPGVLELLNTLETTAGFWLGLLTGNVQEGAQIKLTAFHLDRYFSIGAFGDDHEDRNLLLPIAVERFKRLTKIDLDYEDCVVIGDTPSDVRCSKPYGATSVAVSTGSYGYEDLLETEADHVLRDLVHAWEVVDRFRLS